MNLLALLQNSASSLLAHSAASSTAGHNIQNANTPGYTRQRADLISVTPSDFVGRGYIGRGVMLGTVTQIRDRFLDAQIPAALSAEARTSSEYAALSSVASLDPDAAAGLTSALGNFYSSMRALAQNPSDMGLRQAVLGSSRVLAMSFNNTAKGIESARTGIDAQIQSVVDEVNREVANVARLNKEIRIAGSVGSAPNDLLDARRRSVDRLAELVGAVPIPDGDDNVSIVMPGGGTLVSGFSHSTLSTIPDPANLGHYSIRIHPADGGAPTVLANTIPGGEIRGLLDARDGGMKTALTALDTLALDFGNAVNAVHSTGFALDGSTGRNLFTVAQPNAASNIAVNAPVAANAALIAAAGSAPVSAGDGSKILALIATETTALTGGLSVGATFAKIVTDFGSATNAAEAFSTQDAAIAQHIQTMRDSVSGVSVDEELINLTRSQKAYEATLKVITTADQLLESLLNLR